MRLRLTPRAEADLEGISAYLEPRSPQGAQRVENALRNALILLTQYPEAGQLREQRVRRFPLARYPYLIFYRLDEAAETIEVLTIRHAARQPES